MGIFSPTSHQVDKTKILLVIGFIFISLIVALALAKGGVAFGLMIFLLPFVLFFTIAAYKKPIIALYLLFFLSFFLSTLSRYVFKNSIPVGILIDFTIAYTYLLIFFKSLAGEVDWKKAGEAPIIVLSIWFLYCTLESFNPEAPGLSAWFIGVRPFLYMIFSIPLFCLFLTVKAIKTFFVWWGIFTMILTIKGIIQLHFGLDSAERAMMTGPFLNTHLLWGQLRVFSLCSDAGQFGACQAHAGIVGAILFMGAQNTKQRIFFLLMCFSGIYGMFISGTRGAMFVVFAGMAAYLGLIKNTKLLIWGAICAATVVGLLMFTDVGASSYQIRRMRTVFNPAQDASYQVRVQKQKILKDYLSTRPFGGGLGSMADSGTGIKGSFLGSLWSDSGYVLIWGQTGIVGLCLYIGMFLYFLIKGAYYVWFTIKNKWLRNILIALIAGISGIALAHYGNPVMAQHPTCLILFFSIAVIFIAPRLDKELSTESTQKNEPIGIRHNDQLQPIGRNA